MTGKKLKIYAPQPIPIKIKVLEKIMNNDKLTDKELKLKLTNIKQLKNILRIDYNLTNSQIEFLYNFIKDNIAHSNILKFQKRAGNWKTKINLSHHGDKKKKGIFKEHLSTLTDKGLIQKYDYKRNGWVKKQNGRYPNRGEYILCITEKFIPIWYNKKYLIYLFEELNKKQKISFEPITFQPRYTHQ